MVSALWKACSEGNLEDVLELLKEATSIDIEIKGAFVKFESHRTFYVQLLLLVNCHVDTLHYTRSHWCDPSNRGHQERSYRGRQSTPRQGYVLIHLLPEPHAVRLLGSVRKLKDRLTQVSIRQTPAVKALQSSLQQTLRSWNFSTQLRSK